MCIKFYIAKSTYKKCLEPIISNGIISIQIENFDKNMIKNLELFIICLEKVFQKRKREVMLNIRGHVLSKIKNHDSRSKSRTH